MKQSFISKLSLLLACLFVFSLAALPAAADSQIILTIDNRGGDDNPFIRFFIKKEFCGTGGPFTVNMDIKVTDFRRFAGIDTYSFFVHLMHEQTDHKMASIYSEKKNIDWTNVNFKINNVDKTVIDGALREYCLIDIGIVYAKAVMYIRNFKITNAAGAVVYSIDTDPDLDGLSDLRNIGEKNPEPVLVNAAFGSQGTAKFPIVKGNVTTTTTKGAVYEEDTTTKPKTTTTKKADSTQPPGGGVTEEQTTTNGETDTTDEDTTEETLETTEASGQTETTDTKDDEAGPVKVRKIAWCRLILLIAGIVVVVAGGGAAAFILYKKRRKV